MKPVLLLLLLAFASVAHAQNNPLFTGTVLDARTQAPVPYASLGVPGTATGTVSNAEGLFRLALPTAQGTDSVVVQALGYAPLRLRLTPALLAAPQPLRLTPQPQQLREVAVTGYTPESLLKKAIRTTASRMMNPAELHGYYREFAQTDGRYTKFADAQVDYYIQASPRKPGTPETVQVRVRQSRAGDASTPEESAASLGPSSPIGVDRAAHYYDVTRRNDFLDSASFKFYRYTVQETNDPSTDFYLIHFAPTTHDSDHIYQGTVRVNRHSFAIETVDSEQPAALQQYGKEINVLGIKIKFVALHKHLEYRALAGRYYPSFVRLSAGMTVANKRSNYRWDFTSLLLVSGVAPNPAPIPRKEQYSGSLYKNGTQYQTPYWQQTSVVPATTAEEAVISRLTTGK